MTDLTTPSRGLGRRGFLTAVGGGLGAFAVAGCTNSDLDDPVSGAPRMPARGLRARPARERPNHRRSR